MLFLSPLKILSFFFLCNFYAKTQSSRHVALPELELEND